MFPAQNAKLKHFNWSRHWMFNPPTTSIYLATKYCSCPQIPLYSVGKSE